MSKFLSGFVSRSDFVLNDNTIVSPIYELSAIAKTYRKSTSSYFSTNPEQYMFSLEVFDCSVSPTQSEVNDITLVVSELSDYVSYNVSQSKQQAIVMFTADFNKKFPGKNLLGLSYNTLIAHNGIKAPDYLTFTVSDVVCKIWLSDANFKAFYPDYDIDIVLPTKNFFNTIIKVSDFLDDLGSFNIIDFTKRINDVEKEIPCTQTVTLNIPYRIPNTSTYKDCYFSFVIYGLQGVYEHILKIKLYEYLVINEIIPSQKVEVWFPGILTINEFFIIPRWTRTAIATQVGQLGISSQMSLTYAETFDLDKYVKVYTDNQFMMSNSYNVPFDYNNILLCVLNGRNTELPLRDFRTYYKDLLSVTSLHTDFSRMSRRTQKFITIMERAMVVANAATSTELFNNVISSTDVKFIITTRSGVTYVTFDYEDHRYYVVPRYQYLALE